MKILVTGGSGVIGNGLIAELSARGHAVRLLSRHADDDVRRWNGVEAIAGDVADGTSLRGAAAACDAVVHIAGIVTEDPPEVTFKAVNVDGTANILKESIRSTVRRFIYVSSLGADRGTSDYHRSKREAEELVRSSSLKWTIVRPGNVYGPGDEVISLMLQMLRALPAVPVIDRGDQRFQAIWYRDLGIALANVIERDDLAGRVLEVAGTEITSMNDVLDRLGRITGRPARRVPLPSLLASIASKLAPDFVPVDESKLTMLEEENVIEGENALTELLGIDETPLEEGLNELATTLPEQLPDDGVGPMHEKTYRALIRGSGMRAEQLMARFREEFGTLMPLEFEAEPTGARRLDVGATLTGSLPARGHVQVRVEEVDAHSVLLSTVEGHPLAGTIEFRARDREADVEFTIDIFTRSANLFDFVVMNTIGAVAQSANWRTVIRRVATMAGGTTEAVEHDRRTLSEEEAQSRSDHVRTIIQQRLRVAAPGGAA